MWMTRPLSSVLVLAVVAGMSSWGNQSTVEEALGTAAAPDVASTTPATPPLSEKNLLFLERNHPVIHQLLVTDEWQHLDGFIKYRLVSPRVLKRWGTEDPHESLTSLKELERVSLERNDPSVATALDRSSMSLLIYHATSERFHESKDENLNFFVDAVQLATALDTERIVDVQALASCLTNLVDSERESLLIAERSFRRALPACIERSDKSGSSNFSTSACSFATASNLSAELNEVLKNAAKGAADCWKTIIKELEIVKNNAPDPETLLEDIVEPVPNIPGSVF